MPTRSRFPLPTLRALAALAIPIGVALPGLATAADATPGGSCSTPGAAARYGVNGVVMCSAAGKWVLAMQPSPSSGENGVSEMVTARLGAAMKTVVDQTGDFVHSMLTGN